MKFIKLSLIAVMAISSAVYAEESKSDLEISANVALTSNYVWRGMTQSHNSPAVQGGFDLGYKGAYIGTWASNVNFGDDASVEIDIYAGYANEIMGLTYDVNYCQYTYPNQTDESNFGEASLTLGYDFDVVAISAKYYQGIDTNDVTNDSVDGWKPENGWETSVSVPLPMGFAIDATYGDYGSGKDSVGEYYLLSASKSFEKFDLSVAYTGMDYDDVTDGHDEDGKEANVVATISASF